MDNLRENKKSWNMLIMQIGKLMLCGSLLHAVHLNRSNAANMKDTICTKFANEALSHQTTLNNLVVDKSQTKTRHERFGLSIPK